MSCQKCKTKQDSRNDTNTGKTYFHWKNAVIEIVACKEHVIEVWDALEYVARQHMDEPTTGNRTPDQRICYLGNNTVRINKIILMDGAVVFRARLNDAIVGNFLTPEQALLYVQVLIQQKDLEV